MEKIGEGRWARAANALLAELGPGWEAYSTYRSRLGLWKGAEVFCEGGTPSALLADFVRAAGRLRSAPAGVVRFFGVPEFLRCSSAEELLLKLEVRDGS